MKDLEARMALRWQKMHGEETLSLIRVDLCAAPHIVCAPVRTAPTIVVRMSLESRSSSRRRWYSGKDVVVVDLESTEMPLSYSQMTSLQTEI